MFSPCFLPAHKSCYFQIAGGFTKTNHTETRITFLGVFRFFRDYPMSKVQNDCLICLFYNKKYMYLQYTRVVVQDAGSSLIFLLVLIYKESKVPWDPVTLQRQTTLAVGSEQEKERDLLNKLPMGCGPRLLLGFVG